MITNTSTAQQTKGKREARLRSPGDTHYVTYTFVSNILKILLLTS